VAKDLASEDPAVRAAAAREAKAHPGAKLTGLLLDALDDDAEEVREAALASLASRTEKADRKRAAAALAKRLADLAAEPVEREARLALVRALHDLAHATSIPTLLDVPHDLEREELRARLLAVANVAEAVAVDELIDYGASGRRRVVELDLVRQAIRYATGETVRGDIDQIRAWWRERREAFDFEAAARRRAEEKAEREPRGERRLPEGRDPDGREPEEEREGGGDGDARRPGNRRGGGAGR
jgi:hypothetical protein